MYLSIFTVIDCGSPPSPANSSPVSVVSSTVFGATVAYLCQTGYELLGDAMVTCESNGQWSGPGPFCQG